MAVRAIALSIFCPLAQADKVTDPVASITTGLRTLQDGLLRRDLLIIARRLSPEDEMRRIFRPARNPLSVLAAGIFARRYRANGRPFGLLPRRSPWTPRGGV